jgi:DNA-binding CsgD family transcriptional regulator
MYHNQAYAPYPNGVHDMNDNLRLDIARLEAKVDMLVQLAMSGNNTLPDSHPTNHSQLNIAEASLLRRLTIKQHCVSQLVVEGWKNAEIAQLMGVSDNTIKLHVSAVAKKMGVKMRTQIAMSFTEIVNKATASEYEQASGGIPVSWGKKAEIGMEDKFAPLYAPQRK